MTGSEVRQPRGGVLRLRDFRLLFFGQAVSVVGEEIFPIAATISVLNAGGDAFDVGIVLGARWLAVVSFALIGGVWADRLPRRVVMLGSDVAAAIGVLALALAPGTPHVWFIAVMVFVVGASEAFFRPAETALLPAIVAEEQLTAANSLIAVSYRTAAVVGPGLGGLVVAAFSVHAAYAAVVVALVVSAASLFLLREPPREPHARAETFTAEIAEGVRELRRHPWAVAVIIAATAWLMLVVAPENVLLPVIGRREFGSDTVYAASLALFSLGGVVGAVLAVRLHPRHPGRFSLLLGLLLVPMLLALAFPVSAGLIFACYFVAGVGIEPFNVYWQSALQREIAPDKLARVSSLDWMASYGFMPLGLALTGPLAGVVGEQAVLIGAAVACVVITLAVLRVPGTADFRNPAPVGSSGDETSDPSDLRS